MSTGTDRLRAAAASPAGANPHCDETPLRGGAIPSRIPGPHRSVDAGQRRGRTPPLGLDDYCRHWEGRA